MQTVLLVEGASDRIAIETLARRRGRELTSVRVLALGGATNAGRALGEFGPNGLNVRVAGLCDIAEERYFLRGLERAGFGTNLTRDRMEQLGFFVCDADLEDELIRTLGSARVEQVLAAEGDLRAFRVFQNQPFHRDRSPEQQLHRFFGTIAGRKAHYAEALVDGLDLDHVPRPLLAVLDFATSAV
jgi:hypothetical protein